MPTPQSHGIGHADSGVYSTTVTASGTNRLLVVWLGIKGLDPSAITYNGNPVTEKGRWQWLFTAVVGGTPIYTNAVWWTTAPLDSATLTVDVSPNQVIVAWASFSDVHQASPVHWPFAFTTTRHTLPGLGPLSSQAVANSYVASSDLLYGFIASSPSTGGVTPFAAPGGSTVQLDSPDFTSPAGLGFQLTGIHGTLAGTDTDDWSWWWTLSTSGTDYDASVVAIRDVSEPLPSAKGTYAWGLAQSSIQELPFGDSYTRWADPLALSVRLSGASTTTFATDIGIGMGALTDTHPYVWGDNTHGIKGDGTTGGSLVSPTQIASLSGCTDIAAGTGTVFAICSSVLYGWGLNGSGELGNGTTTQQTTPLALTLPMGAGAPVQVSAGDSWVIVRDDAGNVYHSGDNSFGQRGTVGVGSYTSFGQVALAAAATDISAGQSHALAVLNNSDAVSWGRNLSGECGVGSTSSPSPPTSMSGLTGISVQVSALQRRSMVLTNETPPRILICGINPIPGGLPIQTPTSLGLSGSTPIALGRRSPNGSDWLWTTTSQLFGVGNNTRYELDAFGPYPGPSTNGYGGQPVTTAERVLSDRLNSRINWSHPVGAGFGIIADWARKGRAWAFVLG